MRKINAVEIKNYQSEYLKEIIDLFYHTVHTVNARDYTQKQCSAWASDDIDEKEWDRTLTEHYAVAAFLEGKIVGFGDITEQGYLDRLYVHADYQRRGIAGRLYQYLEEQMNLLKINEITVHSSITARPFFEKAGYSVTAEQEVERKCILLKNYRMRKRL